MVVSVTSVPCGPGSRPVAYGSIYRKHYGKDADAHLVKMLTIERPFQAVGMSEKTAPEMIL